MLAFKLACYRLLVKGKKGKIHRYSVNPLGTLHIVKFRFIGTNKHSLSLIKVSKVSLHFLTILKL